MTSKQWLSAAVSVLACGASALAQASWVALESPSLCRAPSDSARLERLERGAHVLFEDEQSESLERTPPPHIDIANLLATLQVDASRQRLPVKFLSSAPPVIVSGEAAAVEAVRAALADLDRFGRALDVDVRAVWVPGRFDFGAHPAQAVVQAALANSEDLGHRVVRSGEHAELGVRTTRDFVARYSAEVANNSGVADPSVGRILSGRTLHARACRVRGGKALHVEGFFDVAKLVDVVAFDPGTRDLGERIELPRVDAVQVAFSGVVESGGWLALAIEGPPWCSGSLLVQATTAVDPTDGRHWRGFDLALLESTIHALPKIEAESFGDDSREPRVLREPLTSSMIAQLADESSRDAKDGLRTSAMWSTGCMVVPAGESAAIAEIAALLGALEAERTREFSIVFEIEGVKLRLPSTEGGVVRASVVRESTHVLDYDALVAQEIWMPVTRVRRVLDGWSCDGFIELGALQVDAWSNSTGARHPFTRAETGIGALELLERSHRSGSGRLHAGGGREFLSPGTDAPTLTVRFERAR